MQRIKSAGAAMFSTHFIPLIPFAVINIWIIPNIKNHKGILE